MNKFVVFLSTHFPAKPKPAETITPSRSNTLGSQIGSIKQERTPDDYSPLFDECRRIFAGR